MLLRLRRSVVLLTKPPRYAGYSDGGSVLGYPLSDYKFQYLTLSTLSTHRISYVLMKRTVQTPTKLFRLNRATGIPSLFSLFSQSVFLFFRFCLVMGNLGE